MSTVLATPQAAEAAFYRAFEASDLDAMMAVWLDAEEILCIHPMGGRLVGRSAVRESWAQIFAGEGALRFTLGEPLYLTSGDVSVHFVYEEIRFGAGFAERSRIQATNVYVRTGDGWRIQAHHGSPGVAPRPAPPPSGTVH